MSQRRRVESGMALVYPAVTASMTSVTSRQIPDKLNPAAWAHTLTVLVVDLCEPLVHLTAALGTKEP